MNSRIPEQLEEFIRQEAERLGCVLVEVIAKGSRQGPLLEVIMDKQGGITLGECGTFNKKVMAWIAENKMFVRGCTLDVSSPGLDREIKTDSAFLWARGKQVRVTLREGLDGKYVFSGRLVEKNDNGEIVLEETAGGETVNIDNKNVAKIKLNM
ncbi:MAG: hypothetical protein ABH844_04300 [Candidatus Omnitrophota bacterium]